MAIQSPASLMTPGPVPVPEFVREAMNRPIIPHRSDDFEQFYQAVLRSLKYLFQTEAGYVGTMASSGTGCVEAAMYSLFKTGDKVAVINNGKFSKRWVDFGGQLGFQVNEIISEWGKTPSEEAIIANAATCKGIVLTHCETSTGSCLDLESIAYNLRKQYPDILIVVDAITTVGAQALYLDTWDLDCVVAASQKALMMPAGLGIFAVSERARTHMRTSEKGNYLQIENYLEAASRSTYPFTPPLILLYALEAVLNNIYAKGLPHYWNRTKMSAKLFRSLLKEQNGTLFCESPADSLSVFQIPGLEVSVLKASWEREGFLVAGGQEKLSGKVLRVSHMGLCASPELIQSFWKAFKVNKEC